jgi:enoyl-CoA hydratase
MNYQQEGDIAIIRFDDGKANVVGHDFMDAMNEGLDRALADAKVVILKGREGIFSGGFDLEEFNKGAEATLAMVARGFEMFTRIYGHPQPLLTACPGHAVAAGAFILLASDTRIGVSGKYKYCLPETAIGMTLPPILHELGAARLSNLHLTRALIQAQPYDPEGAVAAGFLDEVVAPEELDSRALELATLFAQLPIDTYGKNKRDARSASLQRMEQSVAAVKQGNFG